MGQFELKIEIDAALAEEAERLGVDMSAAGTAGLVRALMVKRNTMKTDAERGDEAKAWARENAEAIRQYEARLERDGIFGEDFRTW